MSRKLVAGFMMVVLMGISSCGAFAQGVVMPGGKKTGIMVDNPEYKMWSNFKPGTIVKYSSTNSQQTTDRERTTVGKQTTEFIYTIKKVTPEKVVVEQMVKAKAGEGVNKSKPTEDTWKIDFPAKIDKGELVENHAGYKEIGKGEEEVEIGDKTYKCEWKEYELFGLKTITEGVESRVTKETTVNYVYKTKTWTCKDVPGGTVKIVNTSPPSSGDKIISTGVTVLAEFTTGK